MNSDGIGDAILHLQAFTHGVLLWPTFTDICITVAILYYPPWLHDDWPFTGDYHSVLQTFHRTFYRYSFVILLTLGCWYVESLPSHSHSIVPVVLLWLFDTYILLLHYSVIRYCCCDPITGQEVIILITTNYSTIWFSVFLDGRLLILFPEVWFEWLCGCWFTLLLCSTIFIVLWMPDLTLTDTLYFLFLIVELWCYRWLLPRWFSFCVRLVFVDLIWFIILPVVLAFIDDDGRWCCANCYIIVSTLFFICYSYSHLLLWWRWYFITIDILWYSHCYWQSTFCILTLLLLMTTWPIVLWRDTLLLPGILQYCCCSGIRTWWLFWWLILWVIHSRYDSSWLRCCCGMFCRCSLFLGWWIYSVYSLTTWWLLLSLGWVDDFIFPTILRCGDDLRCWYRYDDWRLIPELPHGLVHSTIHCCCSADRYCCYLCSILLNFCYSDGDVIHVPLMTLRYWLPLAVHCSWWCGDGRWLWYVMSVRGRFWLPIVMMGLLLSRWYWCWSPIRAGGDLKASWWFILFWWVIRCVVVPVPICLLLLTCLEGIWFGIVTFWWGVMIHWYLLSCCIHCWYISTLQLIMNAITWYKLEWYHLFWCVYTVVVGDSRWFSRCYVVLFYSVLLPIYYFTFITGGITLLITGIPIPRYWCSSYVGVWYSFFIWVVILRWSDFVILELRWWSSFPLLLMEVRYGTFDFTVLRWAVVPRILELIAYWYRWILIVRLLQCILITIIAIPVMDTLFGDQSLFCLNYPRWPFWNGYCIFVHSGGGYIYCSDYVGRFIIRCCWLFPTIPSLHWCYCCLHSILYILFVDLVIIQWEVLNYRRCLYFWPAIPLLFITVMEFLVVIPDCYSEISPDPGPVTISLVEFLPHYSGVDMTIDPRRDLLRCNLTGIDTEAIVILFDYDPVITLLFSIWPVTYGGCHMELTIPLLVLMYTIRWPWSDLMFVEFVFDYGGSTLFVLECVRGFR